MGSAGNLWLRRRQALTAHLDPLLESEAYSGCPSNGGACDRARVVEARRFSSEAPFFDGRGRARLQSRTHCTC
jgi:hypothetical protein